jgi:protein-tyrosine kinase
MDLRKPQIARRLGLPCNTGVLDVLDGQTTIGDAIVCARVGRYRLSILPAETSTMDSSEWMTSSSMAAFIEDIKADFKPYTVILDLPPMLVGDDVIALLPRIDCMMLVTAVGISTVTEVEECNKYLRSANLLRVVVNKVPASNSGYYY